MDEVEGAREAQENILRVLLERERKGRSAELEELEQHAGAEEIRKALGDLAAAKLISAADGRYSLTAAGRKQAQELLERHEIAEEFFSKLLGEPPPRAHRIAHRLEHLISRAALEKLRNLLSSQRGGEPLTELSPGAEGTITMVSAPDERIFSRLVGMGLSPGDEIKLIKQLPRGALLLESGGRKIALARELVPQILVRKR